MSSLNMFCLNIRTFAAMLKTEFHINTYARHIALMLFVLFSLSPCTVKESLFLSVNREYTKPLNKSRTTSQTNTCTYSQQEGQRIQVTAKSIINRQVEPDGFLVKIYVALHPAKDCKYYSKRSSGNSPPKYILYKRLKIDIA
jgi:hypothetical protein